MSNTSGVYLVSSKTVDELPNQKDGYDNPSFTSPDTKVTYSDTNGVDILEGRRFPDKPYRGMGKEDLLHFSSRPLWRRLRMACIVIVVLAWIALIIAVVALVMAYPKCRDPGSRSWWQKEVMYRVYVPSFKDSNGDGVGDLKGLESELDYIQGLGANVISLSPFYQTANTRSTFGEGNDMAIVDHKAVDPDFGTMADFDKLVESAHGKDMYVVLDFIPNLTSDQHPWFINSSTGVTAQRNFYVWATSQNNWKSVYNNAAWTTNPNRSEFYLHQFDTSTPDLNLRSSQVQLELESILLFWMDHGADGFNVRDTTYLFEDYDMRDEPLKSGATSGSNNYNDYDHIYTTNQPEVYSILSRWRTLLRAYNKTTTDKLLMTNLDGSLDIMELYGECDNAGPQMPLNTMVTELPSPCSGSCIATYVDRWMNKVPSGKWANWVVGDDRMSRLASRFNSTFIEPFTMLTLLLPGTPLIYYGDELNMVDAASAGLAFERQQPMRSIMQWKNTTDGGFCNGTCTPWTDVGDTLGANGATGSPLTNLIKGLTALRTEPSFRLGEYFNAVRDGSIFSFVREVDGETGYLVAINFGPNTESRDFGSSHSTVQPKVIVAFNHGSSYEVDDEIDSDGITVGPYGGVVVSWDYMAKEL